MGRISYQEAGTTIEGRLRWVAEDLQEALVPILQAAAGPAGRPSRLVKGLEIDKSLASRLTRALRTEDPLGFIHLLPAPTGLRIFLKAVKAAGVDEVACRTAEESVARFQALIEDTPGGRATLDAAISGSSAEARSRNERTAKQAAYRAMSYLFGFRCEKMITTFAIQPSEDGRMVDAVDLHQRIGMRRLRPTAPVGLFSLRVHPPTDGEIEMPRVETLDGDLAEDVPSYFLSDYSSEPLPDLEMFKEGDQTTIALSENDPPLDSPLTLTTGVLIRNVQQRYRNPGLRDEWRGYLQHSPCKTLVRDVFIREDLYVGIVPEMTLHIPSPKGPETSRQPGLHGMLNTLDMTAPVETLGLGIGNMTIRGVPSYPKMVRESFERVGWDLSRFRGYRLRMEYPVPMVLMTWWFSLPQPPAAE